MTNAASWQFYCHERSGWGSNVGREVEGRGERQNMSGGTEGEKCLVTFRNIVIVNCHPIYPINWIFLECEDNDFKTVANSTQKRLVNLF